jgi:spore coat polysaccharide biosynthesis protein SpsF (cytidylyltransferase family)
MRVVAIVQARMGSTRLPGKALADVAGKPAIKRLFDQLRHATRLDAVVLATTDTALDEPLAEYANSQGWPTYRGSEDDVLDRYYQAGLASGCSGDDVVVRITGDDIVADPEVVDEVVDLYISRQPDVKHASNNRVPTYPYGADVEVFAFSALEQAWNEATAPDEREHVTPYIRNHPEVFPYVDIRSPEDLHHIRLSIDYPEDLAFNQELFASLFRHGTPPFHLRDILSCIELDGIRHQRSLV